jgi:hypothetical protein
MSEMFAEALHHQNVRIYRQELALERAPLKRARLKTLIAREQMAAEDHGWPPTLG